MQNYNFTWVLTTLFTATIISISISIICFHSESFLHDQSTMIHCARTNQSFQAPSFSNLFKSTKPSLQLLTCPCIECSTLHSPTCSCGVQVKMWNVCGDHAWSCWTPGAVQAMHKKVFRLMFYISLRIVIQLSP